MERTISFSIEQKCKSGRSCSGEHIVNNIEITKVHIIDFTTKAPSLKGQFDASKDLAKSNKWPMKVWDATETMDLEVYTRQVAQAEVRTMK